MITIQKLNDLYLLKEKELEESKQEAEKAKKYNIKDADYCPLFLRVLR